MQNSGLRLGLCCQFANEPIKFRTTTATATLRLSETDRLRRLADLCLGNAEALGMALDACSRLEIGAFRINSQILPVKTHPAAGYSVHDLPGWEEIVERFRECGRAAATLGIRLSFHPDQFVVLNSPSASTVLHSVSELEYQSEVAEWVGADVINIHGGGAYGDKDSALSLLRERLAALPHTVRSRLTLENDDKLFTPSDLLPVCRDTGVPLVYDAHHHRCNPDGLSVAEATALARATWNREPLFHISSPRDGWGGPKPERHHDFIEASDFPAEWLGWQLTVDVEAKAKELAVARLQRDLIAIL